MDIIAAIATGGTTPTAIGIVRISGAGCFALCDRVFRPAASAPLSAAAPRTMVYGDVLDGSGHVLDHGLAVRFPGPHSYTGEDSAEFHCHGSPVVLRELLQALFAAGARQAGPGEFTKRAFLNGRLDLTAAEAVVDLIDGSTAAAAKNAAAQLGGSLRRNFDAVTESLLDIASRFYAVVDYPDEDIPDIHPAEIAEILDGTDRTLTALLATCDRGRVLKYGVRTAIVGRPNAGKSSLLNALVGYDRCLVTNLPGTTRDTVEESVLCGGVLLRLIDTAGIRDTSDAVEALGVQRAKDAIAHADLVLAVVDSAAPFSQEDEAILSLAAQNPQWILIASKSDLSDAPVSVANWSGLHAPAARVSVSSVTGAGLSELESAVAALFAVNAPTDGGILTNLRQQDAARRARDAVHRARQALSDGLTPDAVVTDLEEALGALGELTGKTAAAEITERIFSRFCVGK